MTWRRRLRAMPRSRMIWIGATAAVLVPLALLVGMYEYSTSPRFCGSCHIMQPYVEAWKTSTHSFVKCVECHYPPGTRSKMWQKFQAISQVVKYVTRTYGSKPYARIEDESCLRAGCHQTRLLEGKTIFGKGIVFDHRPHLMFPKRGKQLRCTSCHSQIVVGNHITVTRTTCFLCHFKGKRNGRVENPVGGCTSCHTPPEGDIQVGGITYNHKDFVGDHGVACTSCHLDAIQGDGNAPKERCVECHNQPERVERYGETYVIHQVHVTGQNLTCSNCHEEIQHAVRTTTEPLQYDCSVCHEAMHTGTQDLYQGKGGRGVEPMPSSMFLANVDCPACHMEQQFSGEEAEMRGQSFHASEKGCVKCHGEGYDQVLDAWRDEIRDEIANVRKKLDETRVKMLAMPSHGEHFYESSALIREAEWNFEFVLTSKGVHNRDYAMALLGRASQDLDEAGKRIGPGHRP